MSIFQKENMKKDRYFVKGFLQQAINSKINFMENYSKHK